jgi:predicted amidohydrolase
VRIHQVDAARAKAAKLKLGLVQANIGIHEKWRPELAYQQLTLHQRLSHQLELKGAELIVWPESSYPHYFYRDQSHDWPDNDLRKARRGFDAPLLFGSLTVGNATKYPYNSALLLDKDGDVRGTFDKNILMVFGEYIPYYEQLKFIKQWIPETSNWARGTDVSVFTLDRAVGGPVRIGPMICYEDIFPAFGRRLTKREPNLLVNITNDAWFGRTSEPHEHMALAVYRAIEARLDLVRVVNTGVSSFIDATGRVRQKSASVDPDETPGVEPITMLDEIAVLQPVKIYATLGEWFGGLCLAGALVLGMVARARGGRPVRWRLVLAGSAALVVGIVVGGAVFCGPGHLDIVWQLITHRPVSGDANLGFRVGVGLLPAVTLACLLAGALVARQARHDAKDPRPARLESALAVLLVLVAPATLLGQLEGEQAGLVISAMLAIAIALGGARLYHRVVGKTAPPAA